MYNFDSWWKIASTERELTLRKVERLGRLGFYTRRSAGADRMVRRLLGRRPRPAVSSVEGRTARPRMAQGADGLDRRMMPRA